MRAPAVGFLIASALLAQGPPPYATPPTVVPSKWFGMGAPGAVAGNLPGDIYFDNSASPVVEYFCAKPFLSGTTQVQQPACNAVGNGNWQFSSGISPVKCDGTTDNTSTLQAEITAAGSFGGGGLGLPSGTCLTGKLLLQSNVYIAGAGRTATILKLKNSQNTDLIDSAAAGYSAGVIQNISAASGAGAAAGTNGWGLYNLTLDGNKSNQSATSYVMQTYGYGYTLENVIIQNGYSGGWYTDYNNPGSSNPFQSRVINVSFLTNGTSGAGEGFRLSGPSDVITATVESAQNQSHNIHVGPNAGGVSFGQCHSWGAVTGNSSVSMFIEAGYVYLDGCRMEGSDTANLVWYGTFGTMSGGSIFAGSQPGDGIWLGQGMGGTVLPGQVSGLPVGAINLNISGIIENITGVSVRFNYESNNTVSERIYQSSGSYTNGTPNSNDLYSIGGNGLACVNTLATCGGTQSGLGNLSIVQAQTIYSAAGTALPSCGAAAKGSRAVVSDATSPTYGGTYTSGGSVAANVLCNGSGWVTE